MAVYFSLDTQFENLGDEVINGLLLRELGRRQKLKVLIGKAPDWYLANISEAVRSLGGNVEFIADRNRYMRDFVLGSLLQPGNIMLLSCGDVSTSKPNYMRSRVMSVLTRLPFLQIAQVGASRLKLADADRGWLVRAARNGGLITVRDEYSLQTLEQAGINARLLPDLAFLLEYRRPATPTKALFMFRETDADRDKFTALLATMVTKALGLGLEPVFGWQVQRDEPFNRALAEQMGADLLMLPTSGEGRLAPTLQIYDDVAVIVSNRLHALLLAASRGALPIPMLRESEYKVRGVFEHAGLASLLLSDIIAPHTTAEALAEFLKQKEHHLNAVEQAFKTNSASLQRGIDALFGTSWFSDEI